MQANSSTPRLWWNLAQPLFVSTPFRHQRFVNVTRLCWGGRAGHGWSYPSICSHVTTNTTTCMTPNKVLWTILNKRNGQTKHLMVGTLRNIGQLVKGVVRIELLSGSPPASIPVDITPYTVIPVRLTQFVQRCDFNLSDPFPCDGEPVPNFF